jgi:transcriptional pleiotropic regulator of transition state genes
VGNRMSHERPEVKRTGIARRVDELGRIVLPSELRRSLGLREGRDLEIFVEGDEIVLQKNQNCCVFCSREEPLVELNDRWVCHGCVRRLSEMIPTEIQLERRSESPTQSRR